MKSLLTIGGVLLGLGILAYAVQIWYSVFIVGRYYETGGILNNVLLGGLPLWILIAVVLIFKAVKGALNEKV